MSDNNIRANFAADLNKIRGMSSSQEEKIKLVSTLALFYSREPGTDTTNPEKAAVLLGVPSGMKIFGEENTIITLTSRDYSFLAFTLKDKKFYKHV